VAQLRSPDDPETCQCSVTSPVPAGASRKRRVAHVRRRVCGNPGCGRPVERQRTGRPAEYCGATCRQAARRKRVRAEATAQFRDAYTAWVQRPVTKPRSGTPAWDVVRNTNVRHWNRQATLRRAVAELLRALDHMSGPDDPETQLPPRDVAATIRLRRDSWPPE
jgi:hypothetical protein